MKTFNKFCTCIALAAILLSSCSKGQNSLDNLNQEPLKSLEILEVNKEQKMLSFESKDEMLKTISELIFMDNAKRNEWYKSKGNFESQDSFMWKVIDELTEAKTVEEVRSIQNKYSNFFLWNYNIEDEEMNPYIPTKEYGYSFVCNRNGEVLIAGEVFNFNNANSLEETNLYRKMEPFRELQRQPATRATINEWDNHLYVSNGSDRRFWLTGGIWYIAPLVMYNAIDHYAEKKAVFWIAYTTEYYVKYINHSSNWSIGPTVLAQIHASRPNFVATGDLSAHTKKIIDTPPNGAWFQIKGQSRGTGTLEGTLTLKAPFPWF